MIWVTVFLCFSLTCRSALGLGRIRTTAVCQPPRCLMTHRNRGQARSYRGGVVHKIVGCLCPVAVRLAGVGIFESAIAGKPDCYGDVGQSWQRERSCGHKKAAGPGGLAALR